MKFRKLTKRMTSILAIGVLPLLFFVLIAIMNILVILWLFNAVIGVLPSTILDERGNEASAIEQGEPYNPLIFDGSFIEGEGGNEPTFSESELSVIGGNLPNYYKNWYKILGLTKDALVKYPERKASSLVKNFISNRTRFDAMALRIVTAITSSESSGKFYTSGEDTKDVLKDPSDYPPNDLGYGVLGISVASSLEESYGGTIAREIKGKYTPISTPQYPSAFYPWGVPVQVQMFMSKEFWLDESQGYEVVREMDVVLDAFGITNEQDRGLASEFMALSVMYAGYHGTSDDTNKMVVQFIGALLAATKDSNGRISLSRLDYKPKNENNYGEYSFRTVLFGRSQSSYMSGIINLVETGNCSRLSFSGYEEGTFYINGQALTVPLYRYLHDLHRSGSAKEIRDKYEARLLYLATDWKDNGFPGAGLGVTIVNAHLGLNAFLQGGRVYNKIVSMGGIGGASSGGGNAPIKPSGLGAQGIYNGGTLEQFVAASGESRDMNYYNIMKQYFGKVSIPVGYRGSEYCYWYGDNVQRTFTWRPSRWGAPHYYQWTGNYGSESKNRESYGGLSYDTGASVGMLDVNSFDRSACMVFSYAYASTCVTGRVINAAEYATALKAVNGLTTTITNQGVRDVSNALGISIDGPYTTARTNVDRMFELHRKDILLGKGVMVVCMTSKDEPNDKKFTRTGGMHFICLYDAMEENGRYWYRVYDSIRAELCTKWYSEDNIKSLVHPRGGTGICYLADTRHKYKNVEGTSRGGKTHERED